MDELNAQVTVTDDWFNDQISSLLGTGKTLTDALAGVLTNYLRSLGIIQPRGGGDYLVERGVVTRISERASRDFREEREKFYGSMERRLRPAAGQLSIDFKDRFDLLLQDL